MLWYKSYKTLQTVQWREWSVSWNEVSPVGQGLWQAGDQSGSGSGFSCCLWETWTRLWPDHTPSHAASGALITLLLPPEFAHTPIHIRIEYFFLTHTNHEESQTLAYSHVFSHTFLLPSYPPNIRSWPYCSRLSVHGWALWSETCQSYRPPSDRQGRTSRLWPPACSHDRQTWWITRRQTLPISYFASLYGRTLEVTNGQKLWSRSYLPFQFVRNAHAELLGSCLHGPANHQPVAWLEYMQWAGDCGKRHSADKDRNFLVQTGV